MKLLINIIILFILFKVIIVIVGYLGCFFVTKYMKIKNAKINFKNKELINEIKSKNRNNSLKSNLKDYCFRLINGWLRYSIILTGKIPSHLLRNFMYKFVYHIKLGKNVIIYGGSEIRSPYNIEIGNGTIIGDDSKLDGRNGIIIGSNVNFSTGVWIWTDQHNPQSEKFSCANEGLPVIIGNRVWLSCRTVILPGVTIGEGSVIAAGAIVTKDVEPYSIYGGIPAKKIGDRNRNLTYEFDGKYLPFY
ncbi:acyltransferase [Clostridium tyrobutyricum]|uniref:acyltransferase n=1 Tax=Clostridium tyrobutyricum TaxID=1519 RepID=UPI0030D0D1D0